LISAHFAAVSARIGPKDTLFGPVLSWAWICSSCQQFGAFDLDSGAGRFWPGA
jgi:hypothetical protein